MALQTTYTANTWTTYDKAYTKICIKNISKQYLEDDTENVSISYDACVYSSEDNKLLNTVWKHRYNFLVNMDDFWDNIFIDCYTNLKTQELFVSALDI